MIKEVTTFNFRGLFVEQVSTDSLQAAYSVPDFCMYEAINLPPMVTGNED